MDSLSFSDRVKSHQQYQTKLDIGNGKSITVGRMQGKHVNVKNSESHDKENGLFDRTVNKKT